MTATQAASADLEQLQNLNIFISVAESKSIALAAEHLFKARSAVGRSIIALEQSLGVSLFERMPRGLLLNAYGEAVLIRARRIHEEIRLATDEFLGNEATSPASRNAVRSLLFSGRKLQLLIELAEFHNISSVAAHLNMTQAGASMALSRIEAALGQFLFQRRMQGMVATETTERLVLRARRILAELRHLRSDISAISGTLTGSVVVGTTALGRTHFFPKAIAAAIAQHPGLRITAVESQYEQLIGSLRSGEMDIVFGALRSKEASQGLITEPLFTDRLNIVVRAGHPLAQRKQVHLSELLEEKWILPRTMALASPVFEAAFRELGLEPPSPSVEISDLSILRQLLDASDMLALTSLHQLQLMFELHSGSLVELPVKLAGTTREIGFIVREGALLSPAALAVLEAIRSQLGIGHSDNKKLESASAAKITVLNPAVSRSASSSIQ